MRVNYQRLRELLRAQTRRTRDRGVRVKVELILLAARLGSVSEACGRRGFSRKFFYKWWGRLRRARYQIWALEERSRRPHGNPKRISGEREKRIRALHRAGAGARVIAGYLKREQTPVGATTICHVLNGRKRVHRKRQEKLKAHRRRYELYVPGQRLQVDVKYVPEFVGGKRIYNYVAVDECTRWRFARGFDSLDGGTTARFLEALKRAAPFPIHCLQTDNGFEFTYRLMAQFETAKMRIHPMQQWCAENRIRHRCIPPGEKELNGKVERSHRIDEQYFYWKAPMDTLENFNAALSRWMHDYVHKRPHGGVGFLTPWEKLEERIQTLPNFAFLDKDIDALRIKFLEGLPTRVGSKEDRQIHKLLAQIKKLPSAA